MTCRNLTVSLCGRLVRSRVMLLGRALVLASAQLIRDHGDLAATRGATSTLSPEQHRLQTCTTGLLLEKTAAHSANVFARPGADDFGYGSALETPEARAQLLRV